MSTEKKSAIILSVFTVIIILILLFISNSLKNKPDIVKPDEVRESNATAYIDKGTPSQEDTESVIPSNTISTADKNYLSIDSTTLENYAYKDTSQIVRVASKELLALDFDGSLQLNYVLNVFDTTGDVVKLFINGDIIEDIEVGMELKVSTRTYTNSSGVTFSHILKVQLMDIGK